MNNPLKAFLNTHVKPTAKENEYIPRAKGIVCVQRTVGEIRMSPNGTGEWYGLSETKQQTK